jgi:cyclophilin family peptidyl-prolyl cis-trans isomerase
VARQETVVEATDPDFYYVYVNGAGELLDAMNHTVFGYVDSEVKRTDSVQLMVANITIGSSLISFALFLLIVVPLLLALEKKNHEIWIQLKSTNYGTLMEVMKVVQDRLYEIHGDEENDGLDAERNVKNREKRKKANDGAPVKNTIRKRTRYFILMLPLVIVFSIYLITSQQVWLLASMTIIKDKLKEAQWSGMRRMLTESSFYWRNEQILEAITDATSFE